ncbi:hypothetical protein GCM10020220_057180 [Nonomuraea rubra]|uniref:hypothetical protein n=1 Tax=Nonomuraea rubra TaxID=46180 RepID=UPI0031EAE824
MDIVYYENARRAATKNVDDTIRQALARTVNGRAIQVTPCRFRVGTRDVVTHNKLMMIDGFYDDDITPRRLHGQRELHVHGERGRRVRPHLRPAIHDRYLSCVLRAAQRLQAVGVHTRKTRSWSASVE